MFAEALPDNCPPSDAAGPDQMLVYRLVATDPPTNLDFDSHAKRWPEKYGKRCRAFALSVFSQRESLERLLEMKVHSSKKVARLTLTESSGKIQQTSSDATHYSWWRFAAFDAVGACEVES